MSGVPKHLRRAPGALCAVEDCDAPAFKRDWCDAHYKRNWRNGDPSKTRRAVSTTGVTPAFKKQYVIDYKLQRGCTDCGFKGHHAALHFDHLPGHEKVRDIKSGGQLGWQALLDEIAKCEVVCANCHAIRTWQRVQTETMVDAQL
jgi:hypothetical protein